MLLVSTCLNASTIHDIGLFATTSINKGTIVYKPSPKLDISLSSKDFELLDPISKWHILHYGFLSKQDNRFHLAFDDIRFCNHSKFPNLSVKVKLNEYQVIAIKKINKGEELTQNYNEFCSYNKRKLIFQ